MDYPLHYTTEENHTSHHNSNTETNNGSNYRSSYGVFNERSDLSSIIFDQNSSAASPTIDPLEVDQGRSRSSMVIISTLPPPSSSSSQLMPDPWNQHHQHHHYQQQQLQHHSVNHTYSPNDILHQPTSTHLVHNNLSHSERGIAGFVSKLYQCLQSTDTNQKYARWIQREGKDMFIIDNIPEFTETVLPRLFKHCKFPSFVRQLNIYGFQRDTDARKSKDSRDKESCRWFHPCFRPGRRDLFHLIRRKATRYSRKKRAKVEEDPETILNMGSGEEEDDLSDLDQRGNHLDENAVLIVHPPQKDHNSSSSASSVIHRTTSTMPPSVIDYNSTGTPSSQLQLGYPNEHNNIDSSPTEGLMHHHSHHLPLILDTNTSVIPQPQPPSASAAPAPPEMESDHAEERLLTISTPPTMHHHQQQEGRGAPPPIVSSMRGGGVGEQEQLRLQIFHMKRQYERMQGYFEEQLKTAQIQIDDQKLRIQQLEGAFSLSNPKQQSSSVKLGGYMNTVGITNNNNAAAAVFNGNHTAGNGSSGSGGGGNNNNNNFYNNNSSRLLAQQRSLYDYNKSSEQVTPRPTLPPNEQQQQHHFYFQQQDSKSNVQMNNNKIPTDHHQHDLLYISTTPSNNNYHRDTIDKTITAGSNTNENSSNIIESTSSPSISHPQRHHRPSSSSNHMNLYHSYM